MDSLYSKTIKDFSARLPKFPDGRIDYSASDQAPVLNCFVRYWTEPENIAKYDIVPGLDKILNSIL